MAANDLQTTTVQALEMTLDHLQIKQGEEKLKQLIHTSGGQLPLVLLQITTTTNAVRDPIRVAAACYFKNLLKENWDPDQKISINDTDKNQVRQVIVQCMITSSISRIRNTLSEGIALICKHDFPQLWPGVVDQLVQQLSSNDLNAVDGALLTAHSIFKKYRGLIELTVESKEEILNVVHHFGAPLLQIAQKAQGAITGTNQQTTLVQLMQILNNAIEIFYDLNCLDMSDFFEQKMKEWMTIFRECLAFNNPLLIDKDEDTQPDLPDVNKALVLTCLALYLGKFDEEFVPFAQPLIEGVLELTKNTTPQPKQDQLAVAGMEFLNSACKSRFCTIITKDATKLQLLCEKIILSNVELRESDLELFETNASEYVQRDIEGSDADTRRKSAFDLINTLSERNETETINSFKQYVEVLMQNYQQNNKNWRAKDTAMFLITAMAVKGRTTQHGTSNIRSLVPIGDFFTAHVVPELQSDITNVQHPVLKADAIKFISTFRVQMGAEQYPQLLSLLSKWVGSSSEVVYSYAAATIERLLMVRGTDGITGDPKIPKAAWSELTGPTLTALCTKLTQTEKPNQHIMKAINRVIVQAENHAAPLVPSIAPLLFQILDAVSKNPQDPHFNHYLFETLTALIKHVPSQLPNLESKLWESFGMILQNDIQEFIPYVLQVFAHMLELQKQPNTNFKQLFAPLLTPSLYEQKSNIPAIVKLLCAYLRNGQEIILQGNHLEGLLGVFQALISMKSMDHEGFNLLNELVQRLPQDQVGQFMPVVFKLLFTRLQNTKTTKFVNCLCIFFAYFVKGYGPAALIKTINQVQDGLFMNLLQNVWLKEVLGVAGVNERNMCIEALQGIATCIPEAKPSIDQVCAELQAGKRK